MACGNKIKETCGDNLYATCVDYEGTLGSNSKIDYECITIEETTEDLYAITDDITTSLDTSGLGNSCITYPLIEGSIRPKSVMEAFEAKLCELDTKLEDLNDLKNLDITGWGIDFECLSDACNQPIATLGDFVQAISTFVCNQ